jgi:phosphatidylethanolamine-binding protein (PEBP) family uncharacterized protein
VLEILEKGVGKKLTDNHIDKAPGPPKDTGYHRYIFFLLEGDNSNVTVPDERKHWDMPGDGRRGVHAWAEREGLSIIGANFFYAQWEKEYRKR